MNPVVQGPLLPFPLLKNNKLYISLVQCNSLSPAFVCAFKKKFSDWLKLTSLVSTWRPPSETTLTPLLIKTMSRQKLIWLTRSCAWPRLSYYIVRWYVNSNSSITMEKHLDINNETCWFHTVFGASEANKSRSKSGKLQLSSWCIKTTTKNARLRVMHE